MPAHHINQHDPVGVENATIMTEAQMSDLKTFIAHVAEKRVAPAVLSEDQFGKLIATLQPGFELSSLMLADYRRANAATPKQESMPKQEPMPSQSNIAPATPSVVVRETATGFENASE